jgi:hypothetical protein
MVPIRYNIRSLQERRATSLHAVVHPAFTPI